MAGQIETMISVAKRNLQEAESKSQQNLIARFKKEIETLEKSVRKDADVSALDPVKLDLAVRAMDACAKRFDEMIVRNGRADAEGIKIPMPKDPKERAEYEAAIAARKARGGGRFVGDE